MSNQVISGLAFAGVLGAVILGGTGVMNVKHALWLGVGLMAVGLITKPADTIA